MASRRQLPLLADLGAIIPRSSGDDREQHSREVKELEIHKICEAHNDTLHPDTQTEALRITTPLPSEAPPLSQVDAEVQVSLPTMPKTSRQNVTPIVSVFLVFTGLLLGIFFSILLDLMNAWRVYMPTTDEASDAVLSNAVCLSETAEEIVRPTKPTESEIVSGRATSKLDQISTANVDVMGVVVAGALEGVVANVLDTVNGMNNVSVTKMLMGAVNDALEMVVADVTDTLRAVGSESEVRNFAAVVGDTLAAVVTNATDVNDIQDVLTAVVVDTLTAVVSDAIAPPPTCPSSSTCVCDRLAPMTTTIWAMPGQKVGFSIDGSRFDGTDSDKAKGLSHSSCEATSFRWLKTGDPHETGYHSFIHMINVTANTTAAGDGPGIYTQWALCRNSAGAAVDTAMARVAVEMVSVPRLRNEPKVMQVGPGDRIVFDVREQVTAGRR